MASLAPSSSLPLAAEVLLEAEALSGPQAELYARLREAEERYDQAYREAQGGCFLRSPSTGSTSTTWYLGAMQDDIDQIRKELGLKPIYSLPAVAEEDDDTVSVSVSAAAAARAPLPSLAPSPADGGARLADMLGGGALGPAPPVVRVNAFATALGPVAGSGLGWGAPPLARTSTFAAPVHTFRFAADSAAAAGGGIPSVLALEEDSAVDALMAQLRTLRGTLQTRQDAVYDEQARSHDEMAAADEEWQDLDTKIHAIEDVLTAFRKVFRMR